MTPQDLPYALELLAVPPLTPRLDVKRVLRQPSLGLTKKQVQMLMMSVDDSSADPFSVHCLVASGSTGSGFMLVLAITAKSYPRRMIFPPPVGDAESGPEGLLAQLAAELSSAGLTPYAEIVRQQTAQLWLARAQGSASALLTCLERLGVGDARV